MFYSRYIYNLLLLIKSIKHIYLVLALVGLSVGIYAQGGKLHFKQHEVGLFLGGQYYIGDLNPSAHFNQTQPAIGVFYRYTPNYRYAFRGGFNYGSIQGDDSQSNDADQIQRNLNFKSTMYELHALAEFNFLEYRISHDKYKFTTFLFLGISGYYFNPQAQAGGRWVNLQPLKTEGETKPYKRYQMSIPFGIGMKMNVSKQVGIGIEWGPRKTFTDYLDDVSGTYPNFSLIKGVDAKTIALSDRSKNAGSNVNEQRGNPRTKDWYMYFGLTLNFKLTIKPEPCYKSN